MAIQILDQYVANPYLRAIIVLVVVSILLRIVMFILEKVVLRLTSKTNNANP
jgi:hypothetical protein